MTATVALLLGLGGGILVARALFRESKRATIRVFQQGGRWASETTPQEARLKRLMFMRWDVQENTVLPDGAHIELRFDRERSPFTEQRPRDDKAPGKRLIGALVPTGVENASYKYDVWLVDGAEETRLEDPVIVIEGKRG
ncbi:MAG: hypothetical protein IT179_07165 [Acidobacteria bacterium]|nr:hypothetical protein [Acidobacteriota bacterium]